MRPVEKVQADNAKHQGPNMGTESMGQKESKTIGKNTADSYQSKEQQRNY